MSNEDEPGHNKVSLDNLMEENVITCFMENMARAILLFTQEMWFFQVRDLSIVTPRNLVDSSLQDDPTLTRFVPLIEMSLPVRSNLLLGGLIMIYLVFLALSDSLLAQNHS